MEVTSFVDGPVPEGGVPVWIEATGKDDLDQVWLAGKVLAQSGPLVTARLDKTNAVQQLDLRKTAIELANPASSNKTPNDVTSLHYINESSILETLGLRSTIKNAPYTFIGPVLIAVNPLQRVEDVPGTMGTSKASELPHPYAIAETAFSQMSFASDSRRVNKQTFETANQSIVSGGESGAGKTESCKMVLRHLVGRTAASNKNKNSAHSIDARLLSSNPITEAFGNASTKRNENSSRFGKLLRLHFKQDLSQGTTGQALWGIAGASVRTYLLERSRISLHESGERNFHVFYQVLKPHKEWLLNTTEFRYLRALSGPESSVKDLLPNGKLDESRSQDEQDYKELMASFENLAFSSGLVTEILKCVCAILHLGNVEFEDDEASTEGEVALVTKSSQKHLDQCAALLGLSPEGLTTVLVQRRIEIKGDVTMVKRNPSGAAFARDAVAKGCYAGLFDFLIRKIDQALADEGESDVASLPFVGVLDIFGFESFVRNGFEQLLINFANEALQATFNRSVFIAEADLYRSEGLVLADMDAPPDNSSCMELLSGSSPSKPGLLLTIDAQAQVPQANDANMCSALHRSFVSHENFLKPHPKDRSSQFVVSHYAGAVAYTVQSFVEKNNDKLPNEIHALFSTSLVGMVSKELFQEQGEDKKKARSVVAKFTSNIKDLIQTLESTKVSFIRCVKPNAEMKRDSTSNAWFNRKYVSMQLRCLSVPQTANVLRSGLPTRIPYASIASQYKQALSEDAVRIWKQRGAGSEKQFTAALFWAFEIDESIYRLGFSKVFFKSGQLSQLDHVMQATTNWTPAEKDRVGKRFKLYYIRLMWRNACRKVMCQNRFLQLFYLAKRRAMAASKVTAFFRMVGPRKRFLKHYAAQISLRKKESDRIKEENLAKERAEKQRQLELQREQELKKQEEQERAALVLQMERNKELARMAEQQREEARREEERKTQERMASAEGKRLEAEKLHRQALAAQILAEAALAEQRAYEESVRKGKEMTMEERSKALDHFEAEYASQMAKYEARRKYYGNLQNLAKQELLNYNQKITDFLNSDQVKQAMDKAKQVLDSVKAWAYTRFDHFSTPEGRQLEAEAALQKYRETSEKARIAAMRARELLNEQLKDNPWYTKALEQKDRIREMASKVKYRTSSSTRTIIGGANKVVIDKQEWTQPIVSASNQTDRLRVLLDANMITPDEYARLVGTLMEQVETKHESEVVHHVKKQSTMGIQLLCPQCGKEANSTSKKCVHCFAVLIKPQETVSFSLEERWTVPVHGAHGHAFRCRISGVETVLDPDTYMESKLFVVEACNGDGGDSSVFWKVAHPFSDFIHIHRELMEAKSTYITKEAKALIPDFPQAKPDPARRRSSASNLLAMFGKKKKNTISEVGGGVLLTGSDKQSTVKSGEQFLANYLQGLFSAVEVHAAKEDKLGENMLLRFKPMDVFLHFEENTKSQL